MFKLNREMRSCSCGKIKGRYLNDLEAEVSKEAISVAIGNGSFFNTIKEMEIQHVLVTTADREFYMENCKIEFAWLRPNEGPGNPHSKVISD